MNSNTSLCIYIGLVSIQDSIGSKCQKQISSSGVKSWCGFIK